MYAQIIDDTVGKTLVAASTAEKEVKAEDVYKRQVLGWTREFDERVPL